MNAEFIAGPFRFAHRPLVAASIIVTGFMAIGILLDASQDIGRLTVSIAILATAAIMMACSFRLSGKLDHCSFFADGLPYIVCPLASLSVGAVRTYFLIPH